jgi:hypothetical protein
MWIELKNMPRESIHAEPHTIPWRKGQQAWAAEYFKATNKGKCVYTAVACKDGYLLIPMTRHYTHGIVTYMGSHLTFHATIHALVVAIGSIGFRDVALADLC